MLNTGNNASLAERDLNVLWHPCTQMKDHEGAPPIAIKSGKGVWIEDYDGKRYIDAVSSWWVNIFGHGNSNIADAIGKQAHQLEHVILAGFTHEPIVELSEKLVNLTPKGLSRCFYTDNGSSAVEVSLKMSFHYWLNKNGNNKKHCFINLGNSYHGETLGALAVGDVGLYKDTYGPLLLQPITAPSPDNYLRAEGETAEAFADRQADALEQILEKHAHETCAIIVEPLIQCAGYMRMYSPQYLRRLRALCDRYQVHLIADEIAVGFGRTGTLFACEQADITPDFMCLSKGLTGGFLPLAVTLTSDEVYNAFYDDYDTLKAFLHSHSYSGNPLGCAAALATLKEFETRNAVQNNLALSTYIANKLAPLKDHPNVADIRQTGMVAALELTPDGSRQTEFPWQERRGLKVFKHGLKNQALLRPLGNVIYLMPPYVITESEVDHLVDVITQGIEIAVA
ncbi:MAG: adenosylmethionine--8-amino-7-oxononanoate transaminase [Gammaproteobacteria bacterium]|nr:adenosylmethionine--8-amino-7-oxononanoate transaminase [Gammaproteobacteria bacterium]